MQIPEPTNPTRQKPEIQRPPRPDGGEDLPEQNPGQRRPDEPGNERREEQQKDERPRQPGK